MNAYGPTLYMYKQTPHAQISMRARTHVHVHAHIHARMTLTSLLPCLRLLTRN